MPQPSILDREGILARAAERKAARDKARRDRERRVQRLESEVARLRRKVDALEFELEQWRGAGR